MAYAGKNATATAASAQDGKPASVTCGGGNAYAANQNGRTFCVSGKYYSFTYAPNKVDLKLDLPTPPRKSSSSTVQKASVSSSRDSSGSSKDANSTGSSSSGSKDFSSSKNSGSKDSGSKASSDGSTKLVTLTQRSSG